MSAITIELILTTITLGGLMIGLTAFSIFRFDKRFEDGAKLTNIQIKPLTEQTNIQIKSLTEQTNIQILALNKRADDTHALLIMMTERFSKKVKGDDADTSIEHI